MLKSNQARRTAGQGAREAESIHSRRLKCEAVAESEGGGAGSAGAQRSVATRSDAGRPLAHCMQRLHGEKTTWSDARHVACSRYATPCTCRLALCATRPAGSLPALANPALPPCRMPFSAEVRLYERAYALVPILRIMVFCPRRDKAPCNRTVAAGQHFGPLWE